MDLGEWVFLVQHSNIFLTNLGIGLVLLLAVVSDCLCVNRAALCFSVHKQGRILTVGSRQGDARHALSVNRGQVAFRATLASVRLYRERQRTGSCSQLHGEIKHLAIGL